MRASRILVSTPAALLAATLLAACGQKGPLYLPTGEAAAGRATLPQTLNPGSAAPAPGSPASAPPATGTASPVRTP